MATSNFEKVGRTFEHLQYMTHAQAKFLRTFITKHDACDILEIGFYHGKSSAYIAAVLEDLGRGHLVTIDHERAREQQPSIDQVLAEVGLSHRVTPIFAQRSYTWEMAKMIRAPEPPRFDLCYFDGDHTWDGTGFGFVLVDMLLRPGGWIIFDDVPWTIQAALDGGHMNAKWFRKYCTDERATPAVGLVFDTLVPHLGYTDLQRVQGGWWGIARKPLDTTAGQPRRSAIASFTRMLSGARQR